MQSRTSRVNPSEESIQIGPLTIRFLLTGDDSNGGASVFEVFVPVGQKQAAPALLNTFPVPSETDSQADHPSGHLLPDPIPAHQADTGNPGVPGPGVELEAGADGVEMVEAQHVPVGPEIV